MYLRNGRSYESYASKLRDRTLDFPNGKRNKIVLVARELDQMLERKVEERDRQEEAAKKIKEIEGFKVRGNDMEDQLQSLYLKKEILSANGCILLYRSMLQMTQKLALFEMGDLVLEDIPKNQNFLVLHRLLRQHAKL
jgi:hypothetical protein